MPKHRTLDGISFLAVLVGGVGMMNTMLMAVLERTREIGILRALGWRRRAVLSLIMRESLALGLLGGLAGIALSICLVTLIQSIIFHDDSIRMIWTMENVIRALVVASLLALVGGFYPLYGRPACSRSKPCIMTDKGLQPQPPRTELCGYEGR